jgi:hypothetical protein
MQDLSHMNTGISGGGSSMAAGSTITPHPWGGAVGSPSEQSADVEVHDSPELTVPDTADLTHQVDGDDSAEGHGFTEAQHAGENLHPQLSATWAESHGAQ